MLSRKVKLFAALVPLVAAAFCAATLIIISKSHSLTALDQYEIGEYETDPLESELTERQYEAANPWRDPGHISRYHQRSCLPVRRLE